LAICLNWSENIKVEKTQEIFYCGLNETIKFEMTKLGSKDYKTLITTLTEIESFIIDKIYREYQTFEKPYYIDLKRKNHDNNIHHSSKTTNKNLINTANFITQRLIAHKNVESITRNRNTKEISKRNKNLIISHTPLKSLNPAKVYRDTFNYQRK
ncbi:hypothetical protein DMUE_6161, partial [Dictyocoela muelleri]